MVLLFACHSQPPIPADRPILSYWSSSAIDANRAQLPPDFAAPNEHACATDPTRVYIGELVKTGIDDIQVDYHWAPIVPGPTNRRTLGQAELLLAGTLLGSSESTDDVRGDHPFGNDVNPDVRLDPAYAFLGFRAGAPSTLLHTELETRTFPRAGLGWAAQPGDRVLERGLWILDCGHPPYDAELHPPDFIHYARAADAQTTIAAALFVPYRSSLLFNPNPALATDFGSTTRFQDPHTKPFPRALVDTILDAVVSNADRLKAHALLVPNRFDTLDWLVCAPLPRPASARLDAHWRFTARTGVAVRATTYEASGCVRFTATMDATYAPAPLAHLDAEWPWAELSASASEQLGQPIDVRQEIIRILQGKGLNGSQLAALQLDHPPLIDAYPELAPRPGADADSPTAIDAKADDQPFPLYGRVRVGWALR